MPRVGLRRKDKNLKGGSIKESNDEKLEKLYNECLRVVDEKELQAQGLNPYKKRELETDKVIKKFRI